MAETVTRRAALRFWTNTLMLGLALALSGQMASIATAQSEGMTAADTSTGFATLDSAELGAMLKSKDFFFVNVHIPYEGEIEGTDAFIPFDEIADHLDELPQDKDAKIVLYCRSGRMSEVAAAELAHRGYGRVSHLSGGMVDWEASGHDLIER